MSEILHQDKKCRLEAFDQNLADSGFDQIFSVLGNKLEVNLGSVSQEGISTSAIYFLTKERYGRSGIVSQVQKPDFSDGRGIENFLRDVCHICRACSSVIESSPGKIKIIRTDFVGEAEGNQLYSEHIPERKCEHPRGRILVIEDDMSTLQPMLRILSREFTANGILFHRQGGSVLSETESRLVVEELVQKYYPDVMIVDKNGGAISGIDVVRIARERYHNVFTIMMTGEPPTKESNVADVFLIKPVSSSDIKGHIGRFLEGSLEP